MTIETELGVKTGIHNRSLVIDKRLRGCYDAIEFRKQDVEDMMRRHIWDLMRDGRSYVIQNLGVKYEECGPATFVDGVPVRDMGIRYTVIVLLRFWYDAKPGEHVVDLPEFPQREKEFCLVYPKTVTDRIEQSYALDRYLFTRIRLLGCAENVSCIQRIG
jgi:hypothetical protein